jgi:2-methylcitrate dehydratase PrpD
MGRHIPATTLDKITSADSIAKDAMLRMGTAVTLLEASYQELAKAGHDQGVLLPIAEAIDLAKLRHLTAEQIRKRLRTFGITSASPAPAVPSANSTSQDGST